jgi:hypothetical protein
MRTKCLWIVIASFLPTAASSQEIPSENTVTFGIKISAGGRHDDVRMCVATAAGSKLGPAMDVSFVTAFGLGDDLVLSLNVPVLRPLLFAAKFDMLQFEPDITLKFVAKQGERRDLVAGPSLGVSLHYGPDFQSELEGDLRGPSFFALGPRVGAYVGVNFKRPSESFGFELGISPYVTPLFSVNDPEAHRGRVVGGSLDALFRFNR